MLRTTLALGLAIALGSPVALAEMQTGSPELKSAGPLAFSPEGILFIGDALAATIVAIDTEDTAGDPSRAEVNIDAVDAKIAALLGTTADDLSINDIAVNPASGKVYVSVSRGRGPDAVPVLLRIAGEQIEEFSLRNVRFDQAQIPDAPADEMTGEGRRRQNMRLESITDLAYIDGRVYVAGISNEEFASKFRSIEFPFENADSGTAVEIFHGAHGRYETRSPVRTFTAYTIGDEPHLLAAYTCTPLVKVPLAALGSSEKVMGDTVAELGNRNRPLDMVVYSKDGQDYLLMANNARGLMKIPLENIDQIEAITEPVRDKAGLEYTTIDGMEGVVQLDRLNYEHAIALVDRDGAMSLTTFALP